MILTGHYHHLLGTQGTMLKLGGASEVGAATLVPEQGDPAELEVLLKVHYLHCVRDRGATQ